MEVRAELFCRDRTGPQSSLARIEIPGRIDDTEGRIFPADGLFGRFTGCLVLRPDVPDSLSVDADRHSGFGLPVRHRGNIASVEVKEQILRQRVG